MKSASTLASHLALSAILWTAAGTAIAEGPSHVVAPAIEQVGQHLGQESASTQLTLTAWLNLHNKAALDARVEALYAPGSPTHHKWLTLEDIKAYTPTDAEIAAVRQELASHNLKVSSVDPLNLSVRFSGRSSDVEAAFHTQIHKYSVKGELVRTSSSAPAFSGPAASMLHHLGGINSLRMKPHTKAPLDPRTGKAMAAKPLADFNANGLTYTNQCFYNPATVNYNGINDYDQTTPASMTYTGLIYGAPYAGGPGNAPQCGYAPSDVAKIYGLDKAYAKGLQGQGQTIVIVDAFLEDLTWSDGNAFNNLEGLPPLSPDNYELVNPYGANTEGFQTQGGWQIESALDVEWAHAVAPAAGLKLVESYSDQDTDLQQAVLYAITNKLGNVISNSYGSPELAIAEADAQTYDQINEIGASQGISVQYSTGDYGDYTFYGVEGVPAGVPEVSSPADSPFATAIGGTSVAILPGGQTLTTGWGSVVNIVADGGEVYTVPYATGVGGSGGGISTYFAKPSYQSNLSGSGRHLPDVSAIADGYTGGIEVFSEAPGQQVTIVQGGTSLASPVFAGIWSLVNQAYGTSLGQAAPYIAHTPSPFIEDVLPIEGPANVYGSNTSRYGTFTLTADDLAQPLFSTTEYTTALWNMDSTTYVVLSFGVDSSLNITQGWDPVTGYGTPNVGAAVDFISSLGK